MLGTAPYQAPWGASPESSRPSRPWHACRASSPLRGKSPNFSRWVPVAPHFLKDTNPPPRLCESSAARYHGRNADALLDVGNSKDRRPGITPQELAERQLQRGNLALARAAKERALSQESAALKREKMAYARALGAAASSKAIDQIYADHRMEWNDAEGPKTSMQRNRSLSSAPSRVERSRWLT